MTLPISNVPVSEVSVCTDVLFGDSQAYHWHPVWLDLWDMRFGWFPWNKPHPIIRIIIWAYLNSVFFFSILLMPCFWLFDDASYVMSCPVVLSVPCPLPKGCWDMYKSFMYKSDKTGERPRGWVRFIGIELKRFKLKAIQPLILRQKRKL